MPDPAVLPSGATVDAVDWLRSGTRSGLVRVRGRRPADGAPFALPELVLDGRRFGSLPDPRADRDRSGWRGAYVVEAAVAASATEWALLWPGSPAVPIARPPVVAEAAPAAAPGPDDGPPGAEVVDRAVLAERRARRAEAAEQAQARIAQEALRAVEVLEVRAAEIEDRLSGLQAERDALRARLEGGAGGGRDGGSAEAVQRLPAAPDRRPASPEPAGSDADADRRAVRLREALTATVATVADLRMQLHEAQVQRRTRELEWSAEAVRLAVLEREHASLAAELEAVRATWSAEVGALQQEVAVLRPAAEEAAALRAAAAASAAAGAEREAELAAAEQRIMALEGQLSEYRAEVDRAVLELDRAARRAAEAELEARTRVEAAESAAAVAEGRLAHALASIDEVETAREIAEARALAAEAARHTALVAAAARAGGGLEPPPGRDVPRRVAVRSDPASSTVSADPAPAAGAPTGTDPEPAGEPDPEPAGEPDPFAAARARLRAAHDDEPATSATPPVPAQVVAAGAEQARAAAIAEPARPASARLVADLDAAAEDLRRRAAAGARPALAPALVRLAHDDPRAAAQVLAGLLPAHHLLVDAPLEYDLTIREAGTYAVSVSAGATTALPVQRPRGRRRAAFHLRTDARTAAEWLAGTSTTRPRRLGGPLRVSGGARRAKALDPTRGAATTLRDAVRAGAVLDAPLALRVLAYLVDPEWTAGHAFVAEVVVGGAAGTVRVTDGGPLRVGADAPPGEPRVRLRLAREAYVALLSGDAERARVETEGDAAAAAALRGWIDRVLGA